MGNLSVFRIFVFLISMLSIVIIGSASDYHHSDYLVDTSKVVPTPTDGGIVENIPAKYQVRYQKWKAELLATDYGRLQWEQYSTNKNTCKGRNW